jgi:hypothetical protein
MKYPTRTRPASAKVLHRRKQQQAHSAFKSVSFEFQAGADSTRSERRQTVALLPARRAIDRFNLA